MTARWQVSIDGLAWKDLGSDERLADYPLYRLMYADGPGFTAYKPIPTHPDREDAMIRELDQKDPRDL